MVIVNFFVYLPNNLIQMKIFRFILCYFLLGVTVLAGAQEDVVGTVMETYPRRVVVEEGVGQWCGYCPRGIVGFEIMNQKYANSFIGISIHRASSGGTEALANAENYDALVFQGFPNSHVNRHIKHSDPGLPTIETDFRHEVARANMKVTLTDWMLNKESRTLHLTTTLRAGVSHSNAQYKLAYVITENGLQGYQHNYYTNNEKGEMGGWETKPAYALTTYNDVARGIYPSVEGAAESVPAVLVAQTDYTHEYELTIPTQINATAIDLEQIRLTALLIDGATGQIVNAHRVNPNITPADWIDPVDVVTPEYIDDTEEELQETTSALLHFVNRNGLIISDGLCVNMIHTEEEAGEFFVGDDDIKVKKTSEGSAAYKVRYRVISMPSGTRVSICMNNGCVMASATNPEGETRLGELSYMQSENLHSQWGGNIVPGTSCVVEYSIVTIVNNKEVEGEHIRVKYCYPEPQEPLSWGEHIGEDESKHIYNLDALRTYRLAILVAPNTYYSIAGYSGNRETEVANIRKTLGTIMQELNTIFIRDLGVRFEWVDDEKLYVSDYAEIGWTDSKGSTGIHNELGALIDARIGNENYDIGMAYSGFAEAEGMASICGAYNTAWKAHVVAKFRNLSTDNKVVAHELGHMFGANHRDQRTIMSPYVNTHEVPYFSAQNIREMRKYLAKIPYFKDAERSCLVGTIDDNQYNNYVLAKTFSSAAPVLDKSRIKAEYLVPTGSLYQFDLKGTTSHGTPLYRAELDALIAQDTYAWFYPKLPNTNGHFEWTNDAIAQQATAPKVGDVCKFLFAMSNPPAVTAPNFAAGTDLVQYDYAYTQLRFVAGAPFSVQPLSDSYWDYGYRQAVTLNWTYDENLYKNKKVRILLSTDFGNSYTMVLRDSVNIGTAGQGSCLLSMPCIEVDRPNISAKRPGNIKVEILDEPVFGLLQTNMDNGGLTITQNNTRLVFSPEMPTSAHITAAELKHNGGVKAYYKTTSGTEYGVTYSYEEIANNTYLRRWTAMYGTKPYMMEQVATVVDTVPGTDPEPSDELVTVRSHAMEELSAVPQTAGYPTFAERQKLIAAIQDSKATEESIVAAVSNFKISENIVQPQEGHTYLYKPYYQKQEKSAQNISSIGAFSCVHATTQNFIMERQGQFSTTDLLGCMLLTRSASPTCVHWNVSTSSLYNLYQYFYSEEDAITCLWKLEDVTPLETRMNEIATYILTSGTSGVPYDGNNDGKITLLDLVILCSQDHQGQVP